MGLLDGFIEGATGYLAQQEAQNSQTALQLALEKRRRMWAKQDAAAERTQRRSDWVEQQNLAGMAPSVGTDETGQPAVVRNRYAMDDSGAITRNIERLGDAPRVREPKVTRIEIGDRIEYRQYYNDGSYEVLNDENTPRYKPSEGSAPPQPRYKFMQGEDGKTYRVNIDDTTDITPVEGVKLGTGGKSGAREPKGPTPEAQRAESSWLRGRWQDIDKINKGKPENIKAGVDSVLMAAGVDPDTVYSSLPEPPMTDPFWGEPQPDEAARVKMYREAAKKALKEVSDKRLGPGATRSNPASYEDFPPDSRPPPGIYVKLPNGDIVLTK